MSLLWTLWWASILMAGVALGWMAGLILARLRRERVDARREVDRRRVHAVFFDAMTGSGDAAGRLRQLSRRARTMAETLLEVSAVVRGAERDRLIGSLGAVGVPGRLRRRLVRDGVEGRIAAGEALAVFPGPETQTALCSALEGTRNVHLRVAILSSLADIGAPPELRSLLEEIGRGRGAESLLFLPILRRVAAHDPQAALALFREGGRPDQRPLLAEALGATGDYSALDALIEAAAAEDMELRIAALRALGALRHPAAEATLAAALADPAWEVRAAASEATGRIGLSDLGGRLCAQLSDPAWWVRFRAGEALVALGPKGLEILRRAVVVGDDLARRSASLALTERGFATEESA